MIKLNEPMAVDYEALKHRKFDNRRAAVALYASIGSEFRKYILDVDAGELSLHGSLRMPEGIQYAWPC